METDNFIPRPLTSDWYHEGMDRVHVALEHIGHFIESHPAVTDHPEHVALIDAAIENLADLYGLIGEKLAAAHK